MKSKAITACQILAILCFLPFFLGFEDCQIDQQMRDMLESKLLTKDASGNVVNTYVANLPFINGEDKSTLFQTEIGDLINNEIEAGMQMAAKNEKHLKINESGHTFPNAQENIDKLIQTLFKPNATKDDIINGVISGLMEPNSVDVLVSGQYFDDSSQPTIRVSPFIIVSQERRVVKRDLKYPRESFMFEDPNNPGKKVISESAREEIKQTVKELLEAL